MTHLTIGWDIGGANVKAVLTKANGDVLQVEQVACPLWLGLDQLKSAIDEVVRRFDCQVLCHAITMTGELVDLFPDRHTGVMQIVEVMQESLEGNKYYYAVLNKPLNKPESNQYKLNISLQGAFLKNEQVLENTQNIASANWHASVSFVASQYQQALFIDMGSTTTDFVVIASGQPQCLGFTDAMRMRSGELIYTGATRTPLMAIARSVPFAGEWCAVAAEHFATMADVYRLTGDIYATEDFSSTADGATKNVQDSARRLARMVGCDVQDAEHFEWLNLAQAFKVAQMNMLKSVAMRHISRGLLSSDAPIIGVGAGCSILKQLAHQLKRDFYEITADIKLEMTNQHVNISVCFPAYAVAQLAKGLL